METEISEEEKSKLDSYMTNNNPLKRKAKILFHPKLPFFERAFSFAGLQLPRLVHLL
jgi:hypothetical protein